MLQESDSGYSPTHMVKSSASPPPPVDRPLLPCDDGEVTSESEFAVSIARAVRGDESAFAVLVAPHERSLFRHCYRMLGSGPDAEDALQDTLLRAWRRLDTLDASGTLGGWLY